MVQQFRNFRSLDVSLSQSSVYGRGEIGGKKLAADAITVLACVLNCYRALAKI